MATKSFATSDPEVKKVWEEKLFRDAVKESYFSKFMSEKGDNIVHTTSKLEKDKGDRVTFTIRMRATGDGVTGSTQLEGKEEDLDTYTMDLTLEEYRHAVKVERGISEKRATFEITDEGEQAIKDWGTEKVDKICFDAIYDTPTKIFYKTSSSAVLAGSAATAKSTIRAADSKLTPQMISTVKAWATTGGNRAYVPLRPVKIKGKSYYVLLVHPDVLYDLRANSDFMQAVREAEVRGSENPLFTGSEAIWDNVVIHTHENCPIAADGGAGSEPWSRAKLLGAQALCFGWGRRPEVIQEDFDYKKKVGYAWDAIMAAEKSQFNSLDYGSVELVLARTNISGL
jgi:N4-gp56 family major capsid protein